MTSTTCRAEFCWLSPFLPIATDGLLVRGGLAQWQSGFFLVVGLDFTPGFDDPDTLAAGGRVHYWFNDYIKVGVTASRDQEADIENSLGGADMMLRKSAESWLKLETGQRPEPGGPDTGFC